MPDGRCRSCGAAVVWAEHALTGQVAPIDAEPHEAGNVQLLWQATLLGPSVPVYLVGGQPSPGQPLHRSHFATCPDADAWRG